MSPQLAWFKSSYSDSQGGACLEVALGRTNTGSRPVHVRDSKLGESSPIFVVDAQAWTAFLGLAPRT
ncbi:DUF397 domain-containing protein [Streptomyces sp. NPDC058045]|uniref:DUF397 domain-containing protein n=1 Tax=Streptomyces sp. NPDC058045 TaxID=3346311 RepID=UPI0036EBEBE6